MNRLILLGNGFDLAHNLKTSYNDFIKWYFKKCLRQASVVKPFEDAMIFVQKNDYYFGLGNEEELDKFVEHLYAANLSHCVYPYYKKEGSDNDFVNPFAIKIKSKLLQELLVNVLITHGLM